MLRLMGDLLKLIWCFVIGLFRSRDVLEAEIVALRHQPNVLRRKAPKRLVFSNCDRFVFYVPLSACTRHSEHLGDRQAGDGHPLASGRVSVVLAMEVALSSSRPKVPLEIRQLIRDMSLANPIWGAPRIHGELLKLGIDVGQTSVAKYMARHRRPPSQGWKTAQS